MCDHTYIHAGAPIATRVFFFRDVTFSADDVKNPARVHKAEKTQSGRKERTTYSPYKEKAKKNSEKATTPNKQKKGKQ